MIKQLKMYDGSMIAEYDETPELKDAVFTKLLTWFQKTNATTGEAMQSDDFNIEAPEIMADILDDIICFKTKWIDETDNDPIL